MTKRNDWRTPPDILRAVTYALGPYYDPCPPDWDGVDRLGAEWSGPVYVNPPGDVQKWWARTREYSEPYIFAVYNVGALPTVAYEAPWLVIPRSRIKWLDQPGAAREAPPFGSAFICSDMDVALLFAERYPGDNALFHAG
jgi:hypothetical protein